MDDKTPSPEVAAAPSTASRKRKAALSVLGVLFVLAGSAYGLYWFEHGRWIESTDDAYVNGHVVQITPQLGGTVLAVHAEDTDTVKAGQVLVELDRADARVALDQAETALAQTVRETRTMFANNATLAQQVKVRETEVERWKQDVARRQAIANTGAVAGEELEHIRDSLKTAEASLAAAQEQLAASRSMTEGAQVETHPAVARAAAKYEEAWLAWSRAMVTAPVAGQIARRNVQVGQRIAPGSPLMAVIPLEQVWVDANFKEVQLRRMHIGQPVTLVSDVYGSAVEYHGHIAGLGAGTGSAFALLPAQNATGNWIKVVQRVPVRIALEPKELAAHPLRIGLSTEVEVDTHDQSGQALNAVTNKPETRIAEADAGIEEARAKVREIIRKTLQARG